MTVSTEGLVLNYKDQFNEIKFTSTINQAEIELEKLAIECKQVTFENLSADLIEELQNKLDRIVTLNAWSSDASIYLTSLKEMFKLKHLIQTKATWRREEISSAQIVVNRCVLPTLKQSVQLEIDRIKLVEHYSSFEDVDLNTVLPYSFGQGKTGKVYLKDLNKQLNESYRSKNTLVKENWFKQIIFENPTIHLEAELMTILIQKNAILDSYFVNFLSTTTVSEVMNSLNHLELPSYSRQQMEIKCKVAEAVYLQKDQLQTYNDLFKFVAVEVLRNKPKVKSVKEIVRVNLLENVVFKQTLYPYTDTITFS